MTKALSDFTFVVADEEKQDLSLFDTPSVPSPVDFAFFVAETLKLPLRENWSLLAQRGKVGLLKFEPVGYNDPVVVVPLVEMLPSQRNVYRSFVNLVIHYQRQWSRDKWFHNMEGTANRLRKFTNPQLTENERKFFEKEIKLTLLHPSRLFQNPNEGIKRFRE